MFIVAVLHESPDATWLWREIFRERTLEKDDDALHVSTELWIDVDLQLPNFFLNFGESWENLL